MMKENILLVTDLDGTFVADSIAASIEDSTLFRQISSVWYTAIATGRSLKEIKYIEEQNDVLCDYRIGFNGALILDKKDNIIFDKSIPTPKLKELLDYIKEQEITFDALDGENRIGNFQHENPEALWNIELIVSVNPFLLLKDKPIYKINLRPEKEKATQVFTEVRNLFPDLVVYKTGSTRIEITEAGLSKGAAIQQCIPNPGMKVIAVGDSENDISMFKVADVAYCLSHAPERVKQHADYVIDHFADIQRTLPLEVLE